jgi:hypothetical protein
MAVKSQLGRRNFNGELRKVNSKVSNIEGNPVGSWDRKQELAERRGGSAVKLLLAVYRLQQGQTLKSRGVCASSKLCPQL